jgi:TRAP-type C4-dicarboxylate transport system permease small subunit
MSVLQGFAQGIGRLSTFLGQACGVIYAAAVALSVFEVVMRYAFDMPTVWTTEIIMALCATAWMLCVGAVTQQNRHITVTVLEIVIGEKNWRRLSRLAVILSIIAVGILLIACWEPMMKSIHRIERSGSAFNPPQPTYLKTLLVFSAALYVLQLIANLIPSPKRPLNKTPEPDFGQDLLAKDK